MDQNIPCTPRMVVTLYISWIPIRTFNTTPMHFERSLEESDFSYERKFDTLNQPHEGHGVHKLFTGFFGSFERILSILPLKSVSNL